MKNIILLIFIMFNNAQVFAMDSQNQPVQNEELSVTEKNCYNWFVKTQKVVPQFYQKLPQEDRDVLNKGLKYLDNPEAVTRSRYNYAQAFLSELEKANIKPVYDKAILQSALLKMTKAMRNKSIEKPTDLLTTCMYVYSQLLTEQEQATYREDNYLKNPEAAHAVVQKWSHLVCDELIKLQLLGKYPNSKRSKSTRIV